MKLKSHYHEKYLLIISGTVGSGKSIAAFHVAELLRQRGFTVKVSDMTGFHTFCYAFLYVLARLTYSGEDFHGLIKKKISPASLVKEHILDKVHKLVMVLEFASIHLAFLFKIYIPLNLGCDVVVVDEGAINVIGNYIAFCNHIPKRGVQTLVLSVLRLVRSLSRTTNLAVFFLDADDSILMSRWKLRDSPPQRKQPFTFAEYISYLNCLRNAKNIFKQTLNLEVKEINTGQKSSLEASRTILNELSPLSDKLCDR